MPQDPPPPFRINTITTQHICWGRVPVTHTEEQSLTNLSHVFPAPTWLAPFSGTSAFFAPRNRALM